MVMEKMMMMMMMVMIGVAMGQGVETCPVVTMTRKNKNIQEKYSYYIERTHSIRDTNTYLLCATSYN